MALLIKPSEKLQAYIRALPESVELPPNLQNIRQPSDSDTITNADLRWIGNYIRKVISI